MRHRTRFSASESGYVKSPASSVRVMTHYAVIYLACLLYWELLIYIRTQETISGRGLWHILFLIPISVFLAALTGFSKRYRRLNRLIMALLATVPAIYYVADLIYFASFGSLFSVSMIAMGGDAITNFWWSLSGTIVSNIPLIILYLLPVILLYVLALRTLPAGVKKLIPDRGYKPVYHVLGLAASFFLWGLAVLILPIGGKSDASAYGAYHSRFVDTDTASQKLGTLPNTIVEIRSFLAGNKGDTGLSDPAGNLEDNLAVLEPGTGDTAGGDTEYGNSSETQGAVAQGGEGSPAGGNETGIGGNETGTGERTFHQYDELDFLALEKKTDDPAIGAVCTYLASLTPSAVNEYTGKFEGYNLVYICAESFSSYALNEKVTPNLYRLAREGFVLNNYYNSFKNTTTNGEFAMLSGIWPDVARDATMGTAAGTMPQSAEQNMYPALGNMFAMVGAKCYAYHNYKGSYYSRDKSWPNMGFEAVFANNGLNITSGWPGSDLEMFEQSVEQYIRDDQFCTYYMTFSGHGDYTGKNAMVQKNLDRVKELLGADAADWPDNAVGYLACHYELDQALGYLLKRLQETGKMNNTVIVLAADHYPYYLQTKSQVAYAGKRTDANFGMYKSTCILWNGGMDEPVHVDTPCCNVDILPTVLNLFNIPYDSRLYAGVDIFGSLPHIAQIYNKNFVTDRVMYNASEEKATWLDDSGLATEEEKQAYLASMQDIVNKRYSVSVAMHDVDFYNFVYSSTDIPSVVNRDKIEMNTLPDHPEQGIGTASVDHAEVGTGTGSPADTSSTEVSTQETVGESTGESAEAADDKPVKKSRFLRNLLLFLLIAGGLFLFYEYTKNQHYYLAKIWEFKVNRSKARRRRKSRKR